MQLFYFFALWCLFLKTLKLGLVIARATTFMLKYFSHLVKVDYMYHSQNPMGTLRYKNTVAYTL